jgi:DnaJ like chaperone protein
MKWAKWIITGLGWAFMGPIGAILGFMVGSAVDAAGKELEDKGAGDSTYKTRGQYTTPNDIRISFLLLIALVMKADGKVVKSELNHVKKFLLLNFGERQATDLLHV